jgi:Ca-activated chloride channel family protein
MGSEDFQPNNRLEVAKRVFGDFVRRRPTDRIGLLTFARFSTLACPLTIDHAVLLNRLVETEMAEGDDDGTAIGMALASAVNHTRNSPARSRVVVLLTDGENNRSTIDPSTGASVARAFGVTVYTIGVGRVPSDPVVAPDDARASRPRSMLNESALEEIAASTGGRYFRASDVAALEAIFDEIDSLERTELPVARYATAREAFAPFAAIALVLALLELVARSGPLRRLGR